MGTGCEMRSSEGVAGSRRVLYAASTFGHLRSFHLPYIEALRDEGCTVVALAGGDPSGMPQSVRCVVEPFTKSMTAPRNASVVRDVAALVRREGFDEVLVHTSLAAFFVRLGVALSGARGGGAVGACRADGAHGVARRGPRVVNTVHGYLFDAATPVAKRTLLLGAERLVAGVTDDIVTMNAQDTEIAVGHRLCRGRVVQVDGMGVDLARCRVAGPSERERARRELGIPADAFVLLYAAEFSPRKNQAMLVDAMAGLPERAVLALPGRGELLEACRGRAERMGVAGRVWMPGYVEDLSVWRAAADLCVSASRYEGLPFHAVEAMACGLPLVLSAVKGHEDLVGGVGACGGRGHGGAVDDGAPTARGATEGQRCGMLYPFGDVGAFQTCVLRLMDDAALRGAMASAAVGRAQRYGRDRVMGTLMGLYR